MEIERLLNKARRSISKFCYEECKSYCCRKGYLVLMQRELNKVTQKRSIELEKKEILKKIDEGKYSLFMGNYDVPCPSLKDFKCIIHKSIKRPSACKNFPIFLKGTTVFFSSRCLAMKSGLFYPYIARLKSLKYTVSESDQSYDSDTWNLPLPENKLIIEKPKAKVA